MGGGLVGLFVITWNVFFIVISPKSATKTFSETGDCGITTTGALMWTSNAILELLCASSFTPVAAIPAAWTVASAKACLPAWKLSIKAYKENRIILDIFMCKEKFYGHRKHLERYTLNNL